MNNTDTVQAVVEAVQTALPLSNDTLKAAVAANAEKVMTLGDALHSQNAVIILIGVLVTLVLVIVTMVQWRMLGVLQQMTVAKNAPASAPAQQLAPVQAVAPSTIHPGLSDEKLFAIITAAVHSMGDNLKVVQFKPTDTTNWTNQGRSDLHSMRKVA
jgi:hypothetical protein